MLSKILPSVNLTIILKDCFENEHLFVYEKNSSFSCVLYHIFDNDVECMPIALFIVFK